MIKITHIGHACFTVEVGDVRAVFDPYDESIGLPMPHIIADKLFISHEHYDHNNRTAVEIRQTTPTVDALFQDAEIKSWHDDAHGQKRGENIIRVVRVGSDTDNLPNAETCRICHLGDVGQVLTPEQVAEIKQAAGGSEEGAGIDVLMIPVGGNYTIDAVQAREVVRQLSPKIIIPMHYLVPGLKVDIAPVDEFLRLMKEDGVEIFQPETNSLEYTPNTPPGVYRLA
jgi:L-ascorbate metabolism protein UlaG (beta-lactamase superfamily)